MLIVENNKPDIFRKYRVHSKLKLNLTQNKLYQIIFLLERI